MCESVGHGGDPRIEQSRPLNQEGAPRARAGRGVPVCSTYRGVCNPSTDWDAAFAQFAARREQVIGLANEISGLESKQRARAVEYLEEAFATFASPERRQALIVDACRGGQAR